MDFGDIARIFEWDTLIERSTYYELLGVLEIADELEIRRAFREFARAFHPDAHPAADDDTADALRRVFQRGAEAYRVLSRAELRTEYDLALAKGQLRLSHASPSAVGPGHAARPSPRSLDQLCRLPSA